MTTKKACEGKILPFCEFIFTLGGYFSQHNEAHSNTLLIIEILLVISFSSSNVERGFSTINCILTTLRVNLGKLHIDNLMMIRINVPILASLNYDKRHHTNTKSVQKTVPESSVLATEDLFLPKKEIQN